MQIPVLPLPLRHHYIDELIPLLLFPARHNHLNAVYGGLGVRGGAQASQSKILGSISTFIISCSSQRGCLKCVPGRADQPWQAFMGSRTSTLVELSCKSIWAPNVCVCVRGRSNLSLAVCQNGDPKSVSVIQANLGKLIAGRMSALSTIPGCGVAEASAFTAFFAYKIPTGIYV